VREAVGINSPPPQSTAPTITSLGALGALGTQDFFAPAARHRLVIVFTDGETRPFDVQATARALGRSPGVKTIFVHVWSADETVFGSNGQPEHGYHPDPGSGQALSTLAQATGGSSIGEGALGSAARLARAALGSGPTTMEGLTLRTRPLAPWLALASLLPLFVRLGGPPLRRLAGRRPAAESKSPSRAGETALGSAGGSG